MTSETYTEVVIALSERRARLLQAWRESAFARTRDHWVERIQALNDAAVELELRQHGLIYRCPPSTSCAAGENL